MGECVQLPLLDIAIVKRSTGTIVFADNHIRPDGLTDKAERLLHTGNNYGRACSG